MQHNGPKLLKAANKAIMLHTFGVQVGFVFKVEMKYDQLDLQVLGCAVDFRKHTFLVSRHSPHS